ncbi:hypothetical protein K461DRAFT_279299 [Myriangium duriaei CBS 260.36]|uniref:Uncharacterized protein n=1 Tax=Myriangium duriaei CBS 260.36 TaxID=1168546 RepID=A0A9P4J3L6_9PEZI|nr:hypothetical protein K461DRAFT_279299 [Myriangium duriaei CBS 260.36]
MPAKQDGTASLHNSATRQRTSKNFQHARIAACWIRIAAAHQLAAILICLLVFHCTPFLCKLF